MRMLITLLTVLSLSIIGPPGLESVSRAAVASGAVPSHGAQGRKKKRARPHKAKKADKKVDKKTKKSDRGFEL